MAVKIKLKRMGKKHKPFYRVIAIDSRKSPSTGDYLDNLGTYDPMTEPATIELNSEKAKDWLQKGAQPTATVARLFKQANISK